MIETLVLAILLLAVYSGFVSSGDRQRELAQKRKNVQSNNKPIKSSAQTRA